MADVLAFSKVGKCENLVAFWLLITNQRVGSVRACQVDGQEEAPGLQPRSLDVHSIRLRLIWIEAFSA